MTDQERLAKLYKVARLPFKLPGDQREFDYWHKRTNKIASYLVTRQAFFEWWTSTGILPARKTK